MFPRQCHLPAWGLWHSLFLAAYKAPEGAQNLPGALGALELQKHGRICVIRDLSDHFIPFPC